MPAVGRRFAALVVALVALSTASVASANDAATFTGVERIVAIGDVHGDYEQFRRVLRDAGLIDSLNRS